MEIRVKVIPRAARSEIAGEMADGSLKVRLAAVPEDGKANEALRELLARRYGVALRDVTIVSGASSSRKRIRIGRIW